jgi:glycosyltransferase involved in cell wall biosynthesis
MEAPRRRVTMFLYRTFDHDSRVEREATSLGRAGYEVEVIAKRYGGWADRGAPAREERDGYLVLRVDADPLLSKLARRLIAPRAPYLMSSVDVPTARAGGESRGAGSRRRGLGHRLFDGSVRLGVRAHRTLAWRNFIRRGYRLARTRPADVYFGHDLDALPAAARAKRRLGGGLIYDSHELFVDRNVPQSESRWEKRAWARREARLIASADHVFVTTESYARKLADRYGVRRPSVLMNVPSAPGSPHGSGADPLRPALGLRSGQRVLLFLGGLVANRGLESLIESLRLLEGCAAVLMGPGEPAYRRFLAELGESLGVAEALRIADPIPYDRMIQTAAWADVGTVPFRGNTLSYYYSLPNKLFEYIAAGLPVVASDLPEMARVLREHDVGETCDPDDPADIARAVRAVLDDPHRLQQLRANARRAAGILNWEREQPKLLDVVGQLARRQGG